MEPDILRMIGAVVHAAPQWFQAAGNTVGVAGGVIQEATGGMVQAIRAMWDSTVRSINGLSVDVFLIPWRTVWQTIFPPSGPRLPQPTAPAAPMHENESSNDKTTDAMSDPDGAVEALLLPCHDLWAITHGELVPAALDEAERLAVPETRHTDEMPALCRWLSLAALGVSGRRLEHSTRWQREAERKREFPRREGTG
jgi:hypothetical protein